MPRQKRLHNATGSYHVMLRGDTTLLTGGTSHPFRFSGKELDQQNSLNWYDFGARMFDVAGVPMWTSVDPLCEKYYNVSPYVYCAGNPVSYIDEHGDSCVVLLAPDGANRCSAPCCRLDTSLLSAGQQRAERRSARKVTKKTP